MIKKIFNPQDVKKCLELFEQRAPSNAPIPSNIVDIKTIQGTRYQDRGIS
jgi:hypothetical protein